MSRRQQILRWLRVLALLAVVHGVAWEALVRSAGYPEDTFRRRPADSLRLFDAQGRLLREITNDEGLRQSRMGLGDLSPLVAAATVAVEDARFYDHDGVDDRSVLRAALQNAAAGRIVSGASTLTMQLVRLIRPHRRSLRAKLREALLARRIERRFGKVAILGAYLNRAPYGAGTRGVEAAALRLFGKPSRHLSLAEAALVAGLPQSPGLLNPLRNVERARRRQQWVLARMLEQELITPDEHTRALAEPLQLQRQPEPPQALHFGDWVAAQHPEAQGPVHTTLDGDLQSRVQTLVRQHVAELRATGVTQAAAVVLDNGGCEVLAMVGSADYWAPPDGAVNGALAPRQPGSTLKPFAYGLAFERGETTPASVVADVPVAYGGARGDLFLPRNYDQRFLGPVLMDEALARSLNIPALRVAADVGVGPLLGTLRSLGMHSLDRTARHYGLGLVLGNGEVTLLELAQGYATLARGGRGCTATAMADPAERATEGTGRRYSEEAAFLVTQALSDEGLRERAFGPGNALLRGYPVAVKTGTSSNFRDNWALGYTQHYTVAVWVGDFAGRSLGRLGAAVGAGPLWGRIFDEVLRRAPAARRPRPFEPPEGLVTVEVCARSGALPTRHCPHTRRLALPGERAPGTPCPFHQAVALDRRNGLRAGPRCPPEHLRWETVTELPPQYAQWQALHGDPPPPRDYSPFCPAAGAPADSLVITSPPPGEVLVVEPGAPAATQSVALQALADPPVPQIDWLVDGHRVAQAAWPYIAHWRLTPGRHEIVAMAGQRRSAPIDLEVLR